MTAELKPIVQRRSHDAMTTDERLRLEQIRKDERNNQMLIMLESYGIYADTLLSHRLLSLGKNTRTHRIFQDQRKIVGDEVELYSRSSSFICLLHHCTTQVFASFLVTRIRQ